MFIQLSQANTLKSHMKCLLVRLICRSCDSKVFDCSYYPIKLLLGTYFDQQPMGCISEPMETKMDPHI
jgi:hypothetical protein